MHIAVALFNPNPPELPVSRFLFFESGIGNTISIFKWWNIFYFLKNIQSPKLYYLINRVFTTSYFIYFSDILYD